MRDVLLIIHILAAGIWIGASVTAAYLGAQFQRADNVAGAAYFRAYEGMGRFVFNIAAILVLVSGIWLVIDSEVYEFSNAFVSIGFLAVIAGALLGIFVFAPLGRRGEAAFAEGNEAEVKAVFDRFRAFGSLDLLILVFAVVAMVYKWGA